MRPSLVLLILLSPALGRGAPATLPSAGEPVEFPTFGVAVVPPAAGEWVEVPAGRPTKVVQWTKVDVGTRKPRAFLSVDVEEAAGRTVRAFADELAKRVNGMTSVTPPLSVGGEPTVRVHAPTAATATGPQPTDAIVVEHAGWAYTLALFRVPSEAGQADLETLARGVKWVPLEPPVKSLDLKTVRTLFRGRFDVTVPDAMRPIPADEAPTRVHLSLANLLARRTEYFVMIQLLAKKQDTPFEQMEQALIDGANRKTRKAEQWEWEPRRGGVAGGPVRVATRAVEVEHMEGITDAATGASGAARPWMQWGLVKLDEQRVILLHFTINTDNSEDRAAYEQLGGRIVDSVRPGPGAVQLRQ